jgi:hypothetical protein
LQPSFRVLRAAIHESFVFLRKLFEWRSGTGILPMRFNQADIFENSRAGRPCHYFGCGFAALCISWLTPIATVPPLDSSTGIA